MTILKSEKQRQVARLMKKAFPGRDCFTVSQEVQVAGVYYIDLVLDFGRDSKWFNVAVEVTQDVTKTFRTGFKSPDQRIRERVILMQPQDY